MSAERLRKVAAEMREYAEAATPGPWYQNAAPRDAWVRTHGLSDDLTDEIAETIDAPDARHIAAWSPPVALAVADWLDRVASDWDIAEYGYWSSCALAVCDAWEATR